MSLASKDINDTRIITVMTSRIDSAGAIQFKEGMRRETDDGPTRVVLDLSAVDFVDSSGLGAIVGAMKQLKRTARMDLAGLTPSVAKVFRLTPMDTVFDLYDTVDDALHVAAD